MADDKPKDRKDYTSSDISTSKTPSGHPLFVQPPRGLGPSRQVPFSHRYDIVGEHSKQTMARPKKKGAEEG